MSIFKNLRALGPENNESQEQFVRRIHKEPNSKTTFIRWLLPTLVDIYDRLDHLESRLNDPETSPSHAFIVPPPPRSLLAARPYAESPWPNRTMFRKPIRYRTRAGSMQ